MEHKENFTVKELPEIRRPYEKCKLFGAMSLTDSELLAVFLRTGTKNINCKDLSEMILNRLPGKSIAGILKVNTEELKDLPGIGDVKAVQLECLSELVRRVIKSNIFQENEGKFLTPDSIADYFMNNLRSLDIEVVILLLLDNKGCLIKEIELSRGSFDRTCLTPREVFYYALKHKAFAIVILHNHPSGDPTPSKEDVIITKKLVSTSGLVGINFLDHIIIGDNRYVSFKEQKLI